MADSPYSYMKESKQKNPNTNAISGKTEGFVVAPVPSASLQLGRPKIKLKEMKKDMGKKGYGMKNRK